MILRFNHTIHRDDDVELSVTATVFHDEIDDVSHTPEIELTRQERDDMHSAAEQELAEDIQEAKEEAAQWANIDREMERMGF